MSNWQPYPGTKPSADCWCKIRLRDGNEFTTFWSALLGAWCFNGGYWKETNEFVVGWCELEEKHEEISVANKEPVEQSTVADQSVGVGDC